MANSFKVGIESGTQERVDSLTSAHNTHLHTLVHLLGYRAVVDATAHRNDQNERAVQQWHFGGTCTTICSFVTHCKVQQLPHPPRTFRSHCAFPL